MPNYADEHTYHIYNRGAHRSSMFRKSLHYQKCVELLQKYSVRYRVTLIAYCLMPNHYHLMVRQEKSGSISRFLQTTFNAYVQYFNTMEKHSGTLLQGAAKSKRITSDAHLLRCLAYIHTNPVRASLVRNATEWQYSNYSPWVDDLDASFASRQLRASLIGDGKSYEEFVRNYLLEIGDQKVDMDP
jgi:putative transposase